MIKLFHSKPLAFASNAWNVAGGSGPVYGGTAIEAWNIFKSQGRADVSRSRPPRGALVFWDTGVGTAGHVAISLGNWKVVNTRGYDWQALPIGDDNFDPNRRTLGNYLGWVMPRATVPYNMR